MTVTNEKLELIQTNSEAVSLDEFVQDHLRSLRDELERVSAEILSINDGFHEQIDGALVTAKNVFTRELNRRLELEREALKKKASERDAELTAEIASTARQLETIRFEIAALLDDPDAQLSKLMQKRADESVLQAYLDGLLFANRKD